MGFIPPKKVLDNCGAYPNPFNAGTGPWPQGTTRLTYTLTQPCDINIYIFNVAGGLVKQFFFDHTDDATSVWHQVEWNGLNGENRIVSNGTYLMYITADSRIDGVRHDCYFQIGVSR